MRPTLRPYQKRAADSVMDQFKTVNSTAAIWATGLGKSVLASEVIERMQPGRCLVLAHRRELIHQMVKHIQRRGIRVEIEMGEHSASRNWAAAPVVCSSVQTQYSGKGQRMFPYKDFDLLVLDELHHYVGAPAFRGVVEYYRQNPKLKILGLSATPKRTDGAAIGQIFETVADVFEIADAVKEGWLVDVKQQFVSVQGLDYAHIRTTAGDLNGKDLRRVMEAEENVQGMIQPILEISYGVPRHSLHDVPVNDWSNFLRTIGTPRKSIIFATSVLQAQTFTEILNRVEGNSAGFICEKTSHVERAKILQDFQEDRLFTVSNVDILGEGYDNPKIEFIFMARPTKSLSKFTQYVGRGTRPLPGTVDGIETAHERKAAISASLKPWVTIIDFVGNSGKHKIISLVDILGGEHDEDIKKKAKERAIKENRPCDMQELLEEEEAKRKEEIERRKQQEAARRSRLVAKSSYTCISVDPFDVLDLQPTRERPWEYGKAFSEKQVHLLRDIMKLDPDKFTYHQGDQLIKDFFRRKKAGLPSFRMLNWLKKNGLDTNVTAEQAEKTIKAWKANGWRKP